MFGESGVESAPMLVQSITPSEDLNAQTTLVDEGAGVHVAGPFSAGYVQTKSVPSSKRTSTDGGSVLKPTTVSSAA